MAQATPVAPRATYLATRDDGTIVRVMIPATIIPRLFSLSTDTLRNVMTLFATAMETDPHELTQAASAMVQQLFERGLLERAASWHESDG